MPSYTRSRPLSPVRLDHSSRTSLNYRHVASSYEAQGPGCRATAALARGAFCPGAGTAAYNASQSKCACSQCNCPVVSDLKICTLVSLLLSVDPRVAGQAWRHGPQEDTEAGISELGRGDKMPGARYEKGAWRSELADRQCMDGKHY
jgi:hypothetical protein